MSFTRFLRRNRHPLAALAVLVVACLFVLYQFTLNESAHVRSREDLLLLEHAQHATEAGHVYQHLVQQLPKLPLTGLIDDLERLTMVAGTNAATAESLSAKYHTAVRRELEQRASRRLPAALKSAHYGER